MNSNAPADYAGTLALLRELGRHGMDLGLARVRAVAARLGNPERRYPIILVAGTNGKGSVCAMLASILGESGRRVGFYSSPHLVRETERIRVGGAEISEEAFAQSARRVFAAARQERLLGPLGPARLTAFEFFTLSAFDALARPPVDVAVVEVGLGGRLDATNIAEPLLTVIAPVGLDHQQYLGSTLEEIVTEKAGILRPGVPLVSGCRAPEARRVLRSIARDRRVRLREAGPDFDFLPLRDRHMHYAGAGCAWRDLSVGLSGMHQLENAALACAATEFLQEAGWHVPTEALRHGLARTRWRGRLETLSTEPLVLADGAHNPDGARALRRYLEQYVPFRKIHLVFGQRPDKDAEAFLSVLAPVAARITLTQTSDGALRDAVGLGPLARSLHENTLVEPDLEKILRQIYWRKPEGELVVVTGSLYLVGETIARLERGEIPGYLAPPAPEG